MSWFEDAIAAVAPGLAFNRARARMAYEAVRDYDAARPQRRQESWRRANTGAVVEVGKGALPVRNAVRDLIRNNGYAQRAHRTLVSSTVGTGIVGTPQTTAGTLASVRTRDAWNRWVDNCDFDGHHDLYGVQNMLARTMYESGEGLLRFHRQSFGANEKIAPVRLQVLEPDFIDITKNSNGNDGGWIDRGIEYDAQGRKLALWLLPDHPGNLSPYLRTRFTSDRVPVGEVEQVYEMLRPGQDRGISIFAAAVLPLKDLADYFEAEATRKRIEACLALFITSPEDLSGSGLGITTGGATSDSLGNSLTRLAPGMMTRLKPGEDVTPGPVAPVGDMTPFVQQMQFLAAAAGGVMFEHMTGNFSNVNYSSYRVGSFDFARQIEQIQWLTLGPRMTRPMSDRFNEAGRAASILTADVKVRWTPPSAVTSPDPLKDANADSTQMRNLTMAPSEVSEKRGWNHAELLNRIGDDLSLADAMLNPRGGGLADSDPRKIMKGPAQSGQPGDPNNA